MTKKTDTAPRTAHTIVLPASTATTALYFMKRVVVHGAEQDAFMQAYQSLVHALTQAQAQG